VGEKVFVGGVSWQATEADLTQFFSQYGTVMDAKIIRDSLTRKSKGYVLAYPIRRLVWLSRHLHSECTWSN